MNKNWILGCTAALTFQASNAVAEITHNNNDVIIVTGDKFATPLDQVGRAVTVITAEEIAKRQQRFLYDALEGAPGLQLLRTGSYGSLATISIRGLPSKLTLVVQDGVELNDPSSFGNGFNFANFNSADIERVEVLRGAQSTLYGSSAIGGVINVITKDGREGFGGSAFMEGGSFDTLRGGASLYGGDQRFSGRVSVNAMTSNGFSSADEANGNVEDDSFDNLTISSKLRFEPSDQLRFGAVARFETSQGEFDGFAFPAGPVDGDELSENESFTIAGFAAHKLIDGKLENRFSITHLENDRLNLSSGAPTFDALGKRTAYEYQAHLTPSEKLSLIAGTEYDVQESIVDVGFGGNQKIKTIAGFGLAQVTLKKGVTLNGGVRHDTSKDFGSKTTFSISGAAKISQAGPILRASFAEGFRAPTAGELGFNPSLFAESSDGWDLGVEQAFLDGRLNLQATYFDQKITNMIAFDLAAFTFINVEEYEANGVELAVDAFLYDKLRLSAVYNYIDAQNLSRSLAAGNQPKHRANFDIELQPIDRLSLSAGITINGKEIDGAATLQSFTLVNLRGAYDVSDKLQIFARLENAFDKSYQDNFGYGTSPISVFGGVRKQF